MALPTCPKCRQSVLDDDAENCPFCGASMSGKGPAKSIASPQRSSASPSRSAPAGNPPAGKSTISQNPPRSAAASGATRPAQATPQSRPASTAGSQRPGTTKPRPTADEIFDEKTDVSHAIPVSNSRTPRTPEPVTCPMCDTTGYIPAQAFGRDVKCPNPDCLAPIFTAPHKNSASPTEPTRERKKRDSGVPLPLVISISTLVAIVSLGISWFIYVRKPVTSRPTATSNRAARPRFKAPAASETEQTQEQTTETEDVVERPPQQAIDAIIATSGREENNRSKPYCVRLAAYVLAHEGNQSGATEQIERLTKISSPPHYQIEPFTQLAWNAIRTGDMDLAATWLSKARETIGSLGSRGRGRLELSIPLAAACAATDDFKTAGELVADIDNNSVGQLEAAVQISRAIGTYNIRHWLPGSLPGGWENPQRVAVVVRLVAEGKPEAAIKWIAAGKSPGQQFETLLAYLETDLLLNPAKSPADSLASVQEQFGKLAPEAQAGIHARLGQQSLVRGNQEAARQSLQQAIDLFAKSPEPQPLKFEDYEDFLELPFPNLEMGRLIALSAAEIARFHAQFGDFDSAAKWLARAQNDLRGLSLSMEQVFSLDGRINSQGSASFQRELKKVFNLGTADQARRKADEVVRKVTSWKPIADRRFELQFAIYSSFPQKELKSGILAEAASRSAENSSDNRENYEDGSLKLQLEAPRGEFGPGGSGFYLAQDLKSIGSQLLWHSRRELSDLVDQQKIDEATSILRNVEKADDAEYWLTWEVNRLVAENRAADAFRIAGQLSNINNREELIRLISAQAVVTGQKQVAWEASDSPIVVPTVKIAGYTGILEGFHTTAPTPADSRADNP
ncbi:MAG: hypothetical protein KDA68_07620 [Planctomycetaceae bacterium]|nr:hypothetical protein [Planctomycetaceae bacterium]